MQLQEEERLERALTAYLIVAWKILWLTYEARKNPYKGYQEIMTPEEWKVLTSISKSKNPSPTIHQAVRMIAKLGGFLGRKRDGDPGVKTIWIGLQRLTDIMTGWHIRDA